MNKSENGVTEQSSRSKSRALLEELDTTLFNMTMRPVDANDIANVLASLREAVDVMDAENKGTLQAHERLSVVTQDTAGRFLINVIALEAPKQDLLNHFRFSKELGQLAMADVSLTINGVSVNFTRAVNDMWERLVESYEDAVRTEAKELLGATRFNKLCDALSKAEWRISEEIDKAFDESKKTPAVPAITPVARFYTLEQALATTGFHVVTSRAMALRNEYFVIEVNDAGECYQLSPQLERDGILVKERWTPGVFAFDCADLEVNMKFTNYLL